MLNREIYVKPPESNQLVNNGVAEVSEDYSDAALQVLRYELETLPKTSMMLSDGMSLPIPTLQH